CGAMTGIAEPCAYAGQRRAATRSSCDPQFVQPPHRCSGLLVTDRDCRVQTVADGGPGDRRDGPTVEPNHDRGLGGVSADPPAGGRAGGDAGGGDRFYGKHGRLVLATWTAVVP